MIAKLGNSTVSKMYLGNTLVSDAIFGVGSIVGLKYNLLSCWEMDETSGTISNDAHGTCNGTITGATINQTGKINKAYSYSGVNYINFGNVLNFERTNTFTISQWFKPNNVSTVQTLLSKMEMNNNFRGLIIYLQNEKVRVHLRNDNSPSNELYIEFNTNLTASNWYHLFVTYDGSSTTSGVKLYLNGTEITSKSIVYNTLSGTILTTEPFNIGTLNNGTYYNFSGLIDQTAVWSDVITDTNRGLIYNSGNGLAYSSW